MRKVLANIKPCPYTTCGHEAKLIDYNIQHPDHPDTLHYQVECQTCFAEGPLCDTEDAAIQEWNAIERHEPSQSINLMTTTDATTWADEWIRIIGEKPTIPLDRSTMISWFASAIMVGYDSGRRAEEKSWIEDGCKRPERLIHGEQP